VEEEFSGHKDLLSGIICLETIVVMKIQQG
jgi:hypothetical protein